MSDTRTRRDKLAAMAAQSASPEEAAVAQRMLNEYDSAHPEEAARVLTVDERLDRMRDIIRMRWSPGLRVRVVVPDDIWSDPSDWNGVD